MIDVSIVIVTYNSQDYIGGLLDSIKKSKDKLKKEVIIIDNDSQDDSVKVIRRQRLKTRLIESKLNLGFPKAVNLGIKNSQGKYIFLLNPDTKLVGGCLRKLYDFAQETSPLGALAPQLLNPNGKSQPSVLRFPTISNAIRKYFFNQKDRYEKYLPQESPAQIDVPVMAAFFMPRSSIDKVGYLSEKFFMYYEDIEFCRRLKHHGLPVYYLSSAKVKHVHGASGKFSFHLQSPLLKSARTYHGRLYSDLLNLVLLLGQKYQKIIQGLSRFPR